MGFDVREVRSDEKHYNTFICSICQDLVALDAIVTIRCSHPFCQSCLATWARECGGDFSGCPTCKEDLAGDPSQECMDFGFATLAVLPLRDIQPLAFQCLASIQVSCLDTSQHECDWEGDYGQYLQHLASHGKRIGPANVSYVTKLAPKLPSPGKSSPRMDDEQQQQKQINSCSVILGSGKDSHNKSRQKANGDIERLSASFRHEQQAEKSPLKRLTQSLRDFANEDFNSSGNTFLTGGTFPEVEPQSNHPISPPNKPLVVKTQPDTNQSISTSPPSTKSPLSAKESSQDLAPHPVERTSSQTTFLELETKPLAKKPIPKANSRKQSSARDKRDSELEQSYSVALDWNASSSSLGDGNISQKGALQDSQGSGEFVLEFEPGDDMTDEDRRQYVIERGEKLKKQANAKFNKGDFNTARLMYTEGLKLLSEIEPKIPDECELLSGMYSNRAVTFFREKMFDQCIDDCDKAIELDPEYEKSWIRKWRGLMAKGLMNEAFNCLQDAARTIPTSAKIAEELSRAKDEKEIIDKARSLLENGEFLKARDLVKGPARTSDNISLLLMAARIDLSLGNIESCLEKVNKSLRFNPTNIDGMELRGFTLFLSGETEKAAFLLQEAFNSNTENKQIRAELLHCQGAHSALTQGRSCVKRGRYQDAVDHFTDAIKESGPLPPKSPLFAMMRAERAEASLLSMKYTDALRDCQEIITNDPRNATAWTIRSEVLISLGKAEDAMKELDKIRKTWGRDNPTIEEGHKRVDFELRVLQADQDVIRFTADLEAGKTERLHMLHNGSLKRRHKIEKNSLDASSIHSAASNGSRHDEKNHHGDHRSRRIHDTRAHSKTSRRHSNNQDSESNLNLAPDPNGLLEKKVHTRSRRDKSSHSRRSHREGSRVVELEGDPRGILGKKALNKSRRERSSHSKRGHGLKESDRDVDLQSDPHGLIKDKKTEKRAPSRSRRERSENGGKVTGDDRRKRRTGDREKERKGPSKGSEKRRPN